MNSDTTYEVPEWAGYSRLVKTVAIILAIVLVLLWLLGFGPGGSNCDARVAAGADQTSCADGAASNAAAISASAASDDWLVPAYSFIEDQLAQRVYFDSGSADIDPDQAASLSAVIDYLQDNESAVAVLSGYHDPSGDLAFNQELARNRALAVKAYLMSQGVEEQRLVTEKPAQTEGSGDAAEARRVEVRAALLE